MAWEESDIDIFDDESSDQEMANLCLVETTMVLKVGLHMFKKGSETFHKLKLMSLCQQNH